MASGQQWVLVEMVQAFYEVSVFFSHLCGVEWFPGVYNTVLRMVRHTLVLVSLPLAGNCKVVSQEVAVAWVLDGVHQLPVVCNCSMFRCSINSQSNKEVGFYPLILSFPSSTTVYGSKIELNLIHDTNSL